MDIKFIAVGKSLKTKGVKGEVLVDFYYPILQMPKSLFYRFDNQFKPFLVKSVIPYEQIWLFQFESINSKESAVKLSDREVYIPERNMEQNFKTPIPWDTLGFQVYRKGELSGIISEFQTIATQNLWIIHHHDESYMIPIHEDFIVEINRETKQIYLDFPEELISLNQLNFQDIPDDED
ncbi:MAG: hypothetical protein MUE53_01335 [Chitinophagales bacterium]|nr:hypothetical protein [Chitinophagales bacterium]